MTKPIRIARTAQFALFLLIAACSPQQESKIVEEPAMPPPPAVLPLRMSMLDVMRASVEIPASSIWEIQYAETLSDAQWLLLDQDAADLAASASLVIMAGTGKSDASWVANEDWKGWALDLQNTALSLREASKTKDQAKLMTGGDRLAEICEACHMKYRPATPSDGVVRYPFYPKRKLTE